MEGDALEDRAHAVLADAVVDVAGEEIVALEVATILDVCIGGGIQVGGTRHEIEGFGGDGIDGLAGRGAGSEGAFVGSEGGESRHPSLRAGRPT